MPYKIYLKKNEEKRILGGHSWVYANEVAKIEGKDENGSLAAVYANDGRFRRYIDNAGGEGTAAFANQAIAAYCAI